MVWPTGSLAADRLLSGRTYPQVAMRSASVRVCCRPLPFAVAWCWCCYGCCQGTDGLTRRPPPMPGLGTIRHRAGLRVQVSRAWDGPYPGQARCLALGFWPECFRRRDVKGGRRPFPEETRSALDIEGKHVTIQGPSPDLASCVVRSSPRPARVRQARSPCLRCCPGVAVVILGRLSHRARGGYAAHGSGGCLFDPANLRLWLPGTRWLVVAGDHALLNGIASGRLSMALCHGLQSTYFPRFQEKVLPFWGSS
jgi:hypothetical protein